MAYAMYLPTVGFLLNASQVGFALVFVASFVGVAMLLCSKFSTTVIVSGIILVDSAGALGWDWTGASLLRPQSWGLVVVALDASLVFSLPPIVHKMIIMGTLLYLAVERAEASARFGFYTAGNPEGGMISACDCSSPPCATPGPRAAVDFMKSSVVLLTDFVLTRGFATALQQQVAMVDASVSVAAQVSDALARFDLDEAGTALGGAAGEVLPPGLSGSLRQLLHNLASYRPYLPQSCLEETEEGPAESDGAHGTPTTGGACPEMGVDSVCSEDGQPRMSHASSAFSGASHARRSSGAVAPIERSRGNRAAARRSVTLLARNTSGMLAAPELAHNVSVSDWLAEEVERFQSAVSAQGGVSDLLSGDHFTASFGALRVQGTQRECAVRVAVNVSTAASGVGELGALRVTSAVCSGRALCGDFGSDAARRFMIIGGVSSFIVAMERAAAAWRAGTLLDAVVHQDTTSSWHCRLRKRVTFPKLSPKPIGLWEVTQPAEGAQHNDEWMYEMESAQKNPWEAYNNAVMSWCEEKREAALAVVEAALLLQDGAVAEALHALRKQVQEGTAAPEGPLTAGALAGDPSPLSLPE
eukprot:TRINITY_DN2866_c0_g2_i4.p1 TRINITY_DN2866_c0_g2~~TRINITY_DN2866_c0_g2_i4.p1  ORF type:complete len:646 (+),score=109.74 TRINITY_DN2866_c0_g2_i4:183-1940(+)